jgi:hypothetical protein
MGTNDRNGESDENVESRALVLHSEREVQNTVSQVKRMVKQKANHREHDQTMYENSQKERTWVFAAAKKKMLETFYKVGLETMCFGVLYLRAYVFHYSANCTETRADLMFLPQTQAILSM